LALTKSFVAEALRFYPPVGVTARFVSEDIQTPFGELTKGTFLGIAPWAIHHHRLNWENPDIFDPLRFRSGEMIKSSRFSYLPFLDGPHRCPGSALAMRALVLALADLLVTFRWTLPDGGKFSLHLLNALYPPDGVNLCVEKL